MGNLVLRAQWWRAFFRPEVFPLPGMIPAEDTEAEARSLARLLPRGARVLDVACGVGRHSLALARRGFRLTGVDASASYLEAARRQARAASAEVRFLRRDMRDLRFNGEFDAVLNLWTSFGYFPDPRGDLKALRSMREALRPGGTLLLEIIDGSWLHREFLPAKWDLLGDRWALQEGRLRGGGDPACLTDWTFVGPGGRARRARSFVRLYDRRRLRRTLERAGYRAIRLGPGLGALGGRGEPGARILAVARRGLGEGKSGANLL